MNFESPAEYFHRINIRFNGVLAAPLLVFIFLFLEWRENDQWKSVVHDEFTSSLLLYTICPLIVFTMIYGFIDFRKAVRAIDSELDLKTRLQEFTPVYLRSQIFYSITGMMAVIGLYLTGFNFFAVYYLILLFFQSINRPAPQNISRSLRLKKADRTILVRKKQFNNGN